jgi:hypothetical protein
MEDETIKYNFQKMSRLESSDDELMSKLDKAINSILYNISSAEGQLGNFICEVEAHRGREITNEEANELIAEARWINEILSDMGP